MFIKLSEPIGDLEPWCLGSGEDMPEGATFGILVEGSHGEDHGFCFVEARRHRRTAVAAEACAVARGHLVLGDLVFAGLPSKVCGPAKGGGMKGGPGRLPTLRAVAKPDTRNLPVDGEPNRSA